MRAQDLLFPPMFLLLAAVCAPTPPAMAKPYGFGHAPASLRHCSQLYGGHCDPGAPCYVPGTRNRRYGDSRDFTCFILNEQ